MKYEETIEYIRDLAIGYDGFNTVESLKGLIDEMREVAEKIIEAIEPGVEADTKEPWFCVECKTDGNTGDRCENCLRP